MADLLGSRAWNRTKKCKRVNCCNRSRWERTAQRTRERRDWQREWFEETAPEYPQWIDIVVLYMEERLRR